MNKRKIWNFLLAAPAIAAAAVEALPGAVQVLRAEQKVERYNYFTLLPEDTAWYWTLLAAVFTIAAVVLAVVYLMGRKQKWLKRIIGVSFAAIFCGTLPILLQSMPRVIPNVIPALLLCVQCLAAYALTKMPQEVQEKQGPRLELH